MNTVERSCQDFLDALASKAPVPGGGGAAALVGAVGTALATMVGQFTVGKKKYAEVEEDVFRLMKEAEDIRAQMLQLVDADAAAFEPLSRAYAIPKDDPQKAEKMEVCLRNAAKTPMELLQLCCKAISLHREMAQKGSVIMQSDVGTGVIFCKSALSAALLNVKVNTSGMTDRSYAASLEREAEALTAEYTKLADEIYADVLRRYE